MPVYDFKCKKCERQEEICRSFHEEDDVICDSCGSVMSQCVTLWAKTPGRWGDSMGYYDRGLGMHVDNYVHRDKIMKEKNLVPVSDQEHQEYSHSVYSEQKQHNKEVATFTETLKKTGDSAKAAAAAFPCNDI
tara:strand:+ start:3740 stop:4138 length:399 start_codon:yes stop_codon:yes gene_type:complete